MYQHMLSTSAVPRTSHHGVTTLTPQQQGEQAGGKGHTVPDAAARAARVHGRAADGTGRAALRRGEPRGRPSPKDGLAPAHRQARASVCRAKPADLQRRSDSALPTAASVACPRRTPRCRGLPAAARCLPPGRVRVAPGSGLSHDPAQGRNTPPGSRWLGQYAGHGSAAQATSGPR